MLYLYDWVFDATAEIFGILVDTLWAITNYVLSYFSVK